MERDRKSMIYTFLERFALESVFALSDTGNLCENI